MMAASPRRRVRALVGGIVVLCATLAAAQSGGSPEDPEINSSILIEGPSDYNPVGGGESRCMQMVRRAAAIKQSRIMFTPTLFWVDDNFKARKTVNSAGQVTYFCYNRDSSSSPAKCPEPSDGDVANFKTQMQACFKKAVDAGLSIAVAPHLDDGLGFGGWRNGLHFDPLVKYGSYSYADFFLYPLADALAAVISPKTKVWFAMQGEMSATVMYYPQNYTALIPLLKARVAAGNAAAAGNVQVGVSTNFDKLCGCVLQDLVDPSQYLALFPGAFESQRANFDFPSIAALYNAIDFIGISSYPSMAPTFALHSMESATYQFATEISYFGVDVKDLIFNKGKQLFWNEFGVGGGASQNGSVKALTAAEAAATPFFGVFGQYSRTNDPWGLYDLSTPNPVRNYARYFYNQTIAYADSRGACEGCEYRVDGIYIWNDASWDVQAIYPESSSSEGSYRDPAIVASIEAHNAAVTGATPPA